MSDMFPTFTDKTFAAVKDILTDTEHVFMSSDGSQLLKFFEATRQLLKQDGLKINIKDSTMTLPIKDMSIDLFFKVFLTFAYQFNTNERLGFSSSKVSYNVYDLVLHTFSDFSNKQIEVLTDRYPVSIDKLNIEIVGEHIDDDYEKIINEEKDMFEDGFFIKKELLDSLAGEEDGFFIKKELLDSLIDEEDETEDEEDGFFIKKELLDSLIDEEDETEDVIADFIQQIDELIEFSVNRGSNKATFAVPTDEISPDELSSILFNYIFNGYKVASYVTYDEILDEDQFILDIYIVSD